MASRWALLVLFISAFLAFVPQNAFAQTASSSSTVPRTTLSLPLTTSSVIVTTTGSSSGVGTSTTISSSSDTSTSSSTAPDVLLNVPQLSVGRIELDVDNLVADINLNANVASLVSINAGVAVSIQKVNITIVDVDAQLELIVRLGHLVDIVQRVFQSLDLNPLLITALNDVTSVVDTVVGSVDGLLGSITQSGTTLNFIVDNLGNIVQSVVGTAGQAVDTIVGNYLTNMTYTGVEETLSGGLTQKTYSYSPLNALVNIVFNAAGQIVQATVAKATGSGSTSSTTASSTAVPTSTGT